MSDKKYLGHDFEYPRYAVNGEPNHVFEYEKTAFELADKVDGEVVELFYTSLWCVNDATEDKAKFIGYGVLKGDELL